MAKRTVIAADEELLVQGTLTVTGNVTQVESTQLVNRLESDELVINADGDNVTSKLILKSNTTEATISYNHAAGVIQIDKNITFTGASPTLTTDIVGDVTGDLTGDVTGTVSSIANHTTSNLTEGTRLYYTSARANTDFDTRLGTKSTSDLAEGTNLYYTNARADARVDAQTGAGLDLSQKTTSDLAEGTNLYYTQGRFDTAFSNKTTADLTENTNLYFTNARARSSISVTDTGGDGSLSYNSGTGVITYTGPSASEVRAKISVTDTGGDGSLAYNSSTGVITYTGPSASEVRAHFSATNGVSYSNGAFQAVESEIQHDSLSGFVADEHIAHSSVNLTAGAGLTGGGTIAASRTFNVVGGDGITANADDIEVDSTVIRTTGNQSIAGTKTFTGSAVGVTQAASDNTTKMATTAYVTTAVNNLIDGAPGTLNTLNEIAAALNDDASLGGTVTGNAANITLLQNRTLTAGTGLTGGGDLTADRTFSTDDTHIKGLFSATDAGGDGSFSYSNGVFTYTGPSLAEVQARIDNSASNVRAHISGGDGIDFASGVIDVDNTVVRTTGAQSIAGTKTFTDSNGILIQNGLHLTTVTESGVFSTAPDATLGGVGNVTVNGGAAFIANRGYVKFEAGGVEIKAPNANGSVTINDIEFPFSDGTANQVLTTDGSGSLSFVRQVDLTSDQTIAGTKTFTGELVTPNSSSTTTGAIYHDTSANKAYIYVGGQAREITPAVDVGALEDVGATGVDIYAGDRVDGATTYAGIKSIADGTYATLSESANVITVDADIAAIRLAFGAQDNAGDGTFSYNSTTGVFSYSGVSQSQIRGEFSASGATLSYNSSLGAFTSTADNYNSWKFVTPTTGNVVVSSGDLVEFSAGSGIAISNSGKTISITNTNAADITAVTAGTGLSGGGTAGAVTLNLDANTSLVSEGTNLYYTNARADARIANNLIDEDNMVSNSATRLPSQQSVKAYVDTAVLGVVGGSLDLSSKSTTDLAEGTNLYYTDARARAAVSATLGTAGYTESTGVFSIPSTTAHISEGTNLYHTTARARAAISAGGDLSYNSTTGVISYTDPSPRTDATIRGLFSASGDISYNSSTGQFSFTDSDRSDATIRGLFSGGTGITYNSTSGAISLTDTGYVTGVTAGTGLSGGGTSGTVTLNVSGLTTSQLAAGTLQTSVESFVDNDTTLMTSAAISDKIEAYGYSTTVGDITNVSAGTGLTGGGSSGSVSLALDTAGTVGAGTYGSTSNATKIDQIEVDAYGRISSITTGGTGDITNVIAGSYLTGGGTSGGVTLDVDATSANTASKVVARDASGNFSAGVITATATAARYADLAEKYATDTEYEPGTVVVFGGEAEVTVTNEANSAKVAGVISTDPAYMMNKDAEGQYVALRGRVPCKVIGPVAKGDTLVTSDRPGFAQRADDPHFVGVSCYVGKAISSHPTPSEGVIEIMV